MGAGKGSLEGVAGLTLLDEFYRGKRVFVTGHTGFKGAWLSYWLHRMGAQVYGYALPPEISPNMYSELTLAELLAGENLSDVTDGTRLRLAVEEARPEVVFHLAAQPLVRESYRKPARTFETNVMGTMNLLEAVRGVPSVRVCQIVTSDKEFKPRVVVVGLGSTVTFPNSDPFDHNVFSLSQEGPFDLGLYGRGTARSTRFPRPGIIRVYCNVHAQMSAFVVVRDSPWHAQPSADGAFAIGPVPPGDYTLRAWHERAAELPPQPLKVAATGVASLDLQLDARGYKFVQHFNKFGQPYATRGRRY